MLDDGVKDKQMSGEHEHVQVMDVANVLMRSMNGSSPAAAAVEEEVAAPEPS
jgi:hypothetical protein